MTDLQFIHEIAHGNNRAFTELYEMYRSEFIGYIRKSYKGDDDVIFDLYQDSCVALYDNIRIGKLSALNLNVKLKISITQKITIPHPMLNARNEKLLFAKLLTPCQNRVPLF